jgi:hypothetical protein
MLGTVCFYLKFFLFALEGGIQNINLRKITLFFNKGANQVLNVAKMNVLTYQSSNSIIITHFTVKRDEIISKITTAKKLEY